MNWEKDSDYHLDRINETMNEIKKIVDDMKKDFARLGIINTIIIVVVQISTALILHYFLK